MTAAERHVEPRPGMLVALAQIPRFLTTLAVAKHRLFVWIESPTLQDPQSFAFARAADYSFGLLQSRLHDVWALKQGTRLEPRPRYTPTICFESFPFPRPTPKQEATIAAAAKELNELREHWLNPPEWTEERILKFPGSIGGPWDRYIDKSKIVNPKSKIGQVRYPRLGPRDSDYAAKLKERTLTKLYNERPAWLELAHKKLDAAVAAAYGFLADLTDEQILEKLLALNLERAAEEQKPVADELAEKKSINKMNSRKKQREKKAEEII